MKTRSPAIVALLAALLSAAGCANEAAPAPATSPLPNVLSNRAPGQESALEPPPPPRDDGRLTPLASPLRYALDLDIDPNQPRFSGEVKILLAVDAPTSSVVMHGRGLHVVSAVAAAGGKEIAATASERLAHGGTVPEELVLAFAERLPAGKATLTIRYDAPFADGLEGLYRVSDGQRWYAFTQFEATSARRAYPCFDEPGFKVPFDIKVRAPKGMIAVSNMPESARRDEGAKTIFGFATTPPLPSYLVALAVGDLDIRQGPTAPVPIRLVAAKGRAALGELAIDATTALVAKLGDYFGIPYPYPKLDIVAVPDFAAGAMENVGLITFREELLLLDPVNASMSSRRSQAEVIAHELAHHWFGDLVTTEWWNDLWLNEGFATWAGAKVVDLWQPSFGARLEHVQSMAHVMDTDALRSARAVRQPVASTSEAMEAFDGITYLKGAVVLGMLEHFVGEAAFRKGVQQYLRGHAWRNAKADDLLRALDQASGKDVSAMAASFLDKPGVPNVTVKGTCVATAKPPAQSWELTQSVWQPLGLAAPSGATPAPRWTVPVCLETTPAGVAAHSSCVVLGSEPQSLSQPPCGPLLSADADEAGYYRWSLDEKEWDGLFKRWGKLDVPTRIGALSNLWAQVRAGTLSPSAALRQLPALDRETERHVLEVEVDILADVSHALVDDAARPAFRTFVAARMLPHKRRIDAAKPGPAGPPAPDGQTPEDRALLRRSLVWALVELAEDDATMKEADDVAQKWLQDPTSVPPDVAQSMVGLGSRRAGPDRVEALHAAARNAKTPQDRVVALRALGGFGDPTVLQGALGLIFGDDVRVQDVSGVVWSALGHRASQTPVVRWVEAHWDKIRSKLPSHLAGRFFGVAGIACTSTDRDAAAAFFTPRSPEVEGSKRPLALALESAGLCVALHDHGSEDVTRYLAAKK